MKRLLPALPLLLLWAAAAAFAQKPALQVSCSDPQTQYEMNVCAERNFKTADAELNRVYNTLASKLDAEARARLKTAEVSWLKYRDDNCEYEGAFYEGGTMQPLIYSSCKERMTKARTAELREQIKEQEQ